MSRAFTVGFAVFLLAAVGHAEPEYPAAIQSAANIPCAPPCTLCHTTTPGTLATAIKPFAITVRGHGLTTGDPSSFVGVIANLRAAKTDTDGDGIIDVDELAEGTDPSDPKPSAELCGPLYGCAGGHIAKVEPRPRDRAPWLLAGALALLLVSRMRRQRAVH